MLVNFNSIMYAVSFALDCVEQETLGTTTNHGKRVALLSVLLGKKLGIGEAALTDLAACAVLHDNALAQALRTKPEDKSLSRLELLSIHCRLGEENAHSFPFKTNMQGVILYHHEQADGSGFFGLVASNTPPAAQLIHIADILDLNCQLGKAAPNKLAKAREFLEKNRGTAFSCENISLLLSTLDEKLLVDLNDAGIDNALSRAVPVRKENYSLQQVKTMAEGFAKIIDNKSSFTRMHSLGIAAKAAQLGTALGYDSQTCEKLYIAGALHDIGKMAIPNAILEKPGRLTKEEFAVMKRHALYSYQILSHIEGFEEITTWAAYHHEKLNGSGYPFGKTDAELGEKERLMACLDVYQALTEPRPYKPPLSHEQTMGIIWNMVADGQLDETLCESIDMLFGAQAS